VELVCCIELGSHDDSVNAVAVLPDRRVGSTHATPRTINWGHVDVFMSEPFGSGSASPGLDH
jgi:hypothetical protein